MNANKKMKLDQIFNLDYFNLKIFLFEINYNVYRAFKSLVKSHIKKVKKVNSGRAYFTY